MSVTESESSVSSLSSNHSRVVGLENVQADEPIEYNDLDDIDDLQPDYKRLASIFAEVPTPDNGWKRTIKAPNLNIYCKGVEGTPVHIFRGVMTIFETSKEQVFQLLHDLELRMKWDTVLQDGRVVKKLDERSDVIFTEFACPFGISDRDFVQMRSFDVNQDSIRIYMKSVDLPLAPKPRKGVVRAETLVGGFVLSEDPQNPSATRMEFCSQNDIKGLLPTSLVNMGASSKIKAWTKALTEASKKYTEPGIP